VSPVSPVSPVEEQLGLRSWGLPLAVACGVLALAVRVPSPEAVLVTAGVGAVGGITPTPATIGGGRGQRLPWLWAFVLGAVPFAAFVAWFRPLPARGGWIVVGTALVAAVAEELFFRRLVYGWLACRGAALAVAGSALLFAVVHVPVYGVGVLPIDLAAGLIFGWQRWASGSWTVAAATHALANLLALVALR
jgi:membrane protease YdiL (CAAX protease family)